MLVSVLALPARGQEGAPLDSLGVYRDTLRLESVQPFVLRPLIRRETFTLRAGNQVLDTTAYRLDAAAGRLWLRRTPPGPFLVAHYRTWPYDLPLVYRQRGVSRADEADTLGRFAVIEDRPADAPPPDPFGNSRLQRSGSITRGVLAGTNRDVNIESGLRLQLEGEVLDGVNLRAVLTDENTPILAEGTTQRLSEFDRVYIEITGKRAEARLGDVDLVLRGSELASVTRKVQGAAAVARVPGTGVFGGATVEVAGAAPRGQFRVQEIRPIEGVQGPYRLEGQMGEPYILVIPGSEVVYLDGLRLVRDRDADYTIDYATGEITFTPRRLLTSENRITVEFQYTTNQYPRTLVATRGEARFGATPGGGPRATIGATFIREADARALSVDLDLTPEDSLQLAGSGDRDVVRSGAERVVFDAQAPYVQYRAEQQGEDSVFVALDQRPPDSVAVYRVRFSRVASGTGRYARGQRGVNGIAYQFVGTGGDYEPRPPAPETPRTGAAGRSGPLPAHSEGGGLRRVGALAQRPQPPLQPRRLRRRGQRLRGGPADREDARRALGRGRGAAFAAAPDGPVRLVRPHTAHRLRPDVEPHRRLRQRRRQPGGCRPRGGGRGRGAVVLLADEPPQRGLRAAGARRGLHKPSCGVATRRGGGPRPAGFLWR